jgi:hypothetical protein
MSRKAGFHLSFGRQRAYSAASDLPHRKLSRNEEAVHEYQREYDRQVRHDRG